MAITEQERIDAVVRRLATRLDVPVDALEIEVRACYREWDHARVRDFVPIFVERAVRDRVRRGVASFR